MSGPEEVRKVLEDFVDALHDKVGAHRLEELLQGHDSPTGAELGSQPEPWTRRHLIRPLLDISELDWEPELHGGGEGYPDFGINNLDILVIGEDKSLNKIEKGEKEVREYLNNRAASRGAEYGIATDGIQWTLYRLELGGDYLDFTPVKPTPFSFRQELLQIARNKNYISQSGTSDGDIDKKTKLFYETFNREKLNTLLTQEAPRLIRSKKKKGIEEFYDLYVELLFGEGSGSYDYSTTLIDDIQSPKSTTETGKRRFVIKLVNRLLFVKFLEDGVLPENFLNERVDKFQQAQSEVDQFGGGLYKTQIEPLFFNLFNTPSEDRISKHRGSWMDQVPYLNGSLFAPEDREREFDVDDRMLVTVVKDLIEGHKLSEDNGGSTLDPSVLGNVFEMTINHISGGQSQKEEGAYYTPNDVIRLITEQSVDPKIYDVLAEVYTRQLSDGSNLSEEQAQSLVTEYDLGEMLREIEQREGYFSDPQTIQEAYEKLGCLKVIDPACGSGHFLTAVLDEIHRVRMSLLRGLKGDELTEEDIYSSKKELVLNAIYGVDINPIGIEIAKLRVWLKMVEQGWSEGFGQLPNIDINIVPGNSLIGLPAKSSGQSLLRSFDVDLSGIREIRDQYKSGEINRRELNDSIANLKPELRQIYIDNLNHYFEDEIEEVEKFDALTQNLESLYPVITAVRARLNDSSALSEGDKKKLEELGFTTYKKSARLDGESLTGRQDDLRTLVEEGYKLELERRNTKYDLKSLENLGELSHEAFHWVVEFPEAVKNDGTGYSVEFDIVVGNPPYGDLVTDIEQRFTAGYKTGNIRDVAAQFLERQLQILAEDGRFGNVITLRLIYDSKARVSRGVLNDNLSNIRIACFGWRPSYIFAGSEALAAIITGKKAKQSIDEIQTSRFILFNDEDRKRRIENIDYWEIDDLVLGEKIGGGKVGEKTDKSLPKVGTKTAKSVLEKLADASGMTIRDIELDEETEHKVWRKEGARYWINPLLESLWSEEDRSRETKPMYFSSELERYTVFLLMQSSLFYNHWMTYGDQQHVSWKLVRSFPVPDIKDLEKHDAEIERLAEELWSGIENRFRPDINVSGEIQGVAELKPLVDEIDELFGPMYDLSEDEIEYVKQLDREYGRSMRDPGQAELPSADSETVEAEEGE